MNAAQAKTAISPTYVGMQYQITKDRIEELGSKLTDRLKEEDGEIASWLVFVVTLALAIGAVATALVGWANTKVTELP